MIHNDYRVPVHEAGHSLMALLWLGHAGSITLDGKGNGGCVGYDWNEDLGVVSGVGEAYALVRAHRAIAGEVAERLIFGDADAGSVQDRACVSACVEFLGEKGVHIPVETFKATASYLLQGHRRGLLAMAKEGYDKWTGTISGKRLYDVAASRDPALIACADRPLLESKGSQTWRQTWQALCEACGVPRYARGLSDASW
jgi:hypothetical protein